EFLNRISEWIIHRVAYSTLPYFLSGLIAVELTGLAYVQLEPHYRHADQVPDKEHALAATDRSDEKLTGANPVHVMIEWNGGQSLYDSRTFEVNARAHAGLGR